MRPRGTAEITALTELIGEFSSDAQVPFPYRWPGRLQHPSDDVELEPLPGHQAHDLGVERFSVRDQLADVPITVIGVQVSLAVIRRDHPQRPMERRRLGTEGFTSTRGR